MERKLKRCVVLCFISVKEQCIAGWIMGVDMVKRYAWKHTYKPVGKARQDRAEVVGVSEAGTVLTGCARHLEIGILTPATVHHRARAPISRRRRRRRVVFLGDDPDAGILAVTCAAGAAAVRRDHRWLLGHVR